MKKNGILNSGIAKIADDLGHTDLVCIADLGLPVPASVKKIDLALKPGLPSFQEVLSDYLEHILVEKVYLAEEIKKTNPKQLVQIREKLPQEVEIIFLSHEDLKVMTSKTKAVVRTGEATPYSNIILQSGVII
jgi:D-ribose pyranase